MNRHTKFFLPAFLLFCLEIFGQPEYSTLDIKKPEKYENVHLGAEKTDETKFKMARHFIQNTVTHFNYYYNANNKLNEIIARARAQNKDNYDKLLSFYDYSLDVTARDKKELDSIIYKATAGILNHDLRNDWIDNLYILMGKAYYFRKQFDTAYITFQFINYAFSPKEEGGYDKTIGSNIGGEKGGNSLIVATQEKTNVAKKLLSLPPSRNEALVWQIRTYISNGQLPEAAGLIELLKQDAFFPKRLQPDLDEMQALLFYTQDIYDSTARHLIKTLPALIDKQEMFRREYLIAQLYERSKRPAKAQEYYKKVYEQTYDPVMEVYARLNYIRQNKGTDDKMIQLNINALLAMAAKARFENYRDIIYYAAAQMELERKNKPGAIVLLKRSLKFAVPENNQRNKAYLLLADLYFSDRDYRPARNYYDSVDITDKSLIENPAEFGDKRKALDKIVAQLDVIARQDSLQRIAAMAQPERDAYIKRLVKLLRKKQGLRDEEQYGFSSFGLNSNGPTSLFSTSGDNTEWYFNNPSIMAKGYQDFKSRWGNRPNTDFWQVSSKASQVLVKARSDADDQSANTDSAKKSGGITYESLLKNVPLTPEKLKKSNDSIENSLFVIGKSLQEGISDYRTAIHSYDSLLTRFPVTHLREEIWFNEYYCYKKLGDEENAKRILKLMNEKFPSGKLTNMATYPEAYKKAADAPRLEATRRYDNIYNAFIEGRFEEAQANKKNADSLYGDKYWTPQLLYIEALYDIRQRMDNEAKADLNVIIQKYKTSPMAAKAKTFLDVLSRRKQIEEYLTNLKIERAKDDSVVITPDEPPVNHLVQKNISEPERAAQKVRNDSLETARLKMIRLQHQMDSIRSAMLQANNDSLKSANLKRQSDSLLYSLRKMKQDSALMARQLAISKSAFAYTPNAPHQVVILMNKVDPVYVNETRNAFNRYDRENYYNKTFEISAIPWNDSVRLVVIKGFDNADEAVDYVTKTKKVMAREIIPWLPADKYSLMIITDQNLELLKINKDLPGYHKFLQTLYPGLF